MSFSTGGHSDATVPPSAGLPVVASYCPFFLKKEMRHVYRQVTGLQRHQTFVLTKSRLNAVEFPFSDIEVLPKPRVNLWRRLWQKHVLGLEPLIYRGEFEQLGVVMRRRHADLLHVYFGHTGVHLLPFLRSWPGPALVSFHGMDIMERDHEPGYNERLRALLGFLPMILARSESLADRLVDMGCDPAKIRINRTGIPLEKFPAAVRHVPENGEWRIVQACRLIEKKGLPDTLKAFATFRNAHSQARLILAGEGPLRNSLEKLASELGLGGVVDFTGFLDSEALQALYHSAQIFIHPSRTTAAGDQEGVPNSLLEAMASGLPVVATQHGGIPEAVRHGEEGFLVPENSSEALADALENLASRPGCLGAFSVAAASGVRMRFDIHRSVARLEDFYEELRALGRPDQSSRGASLQSDSSP